ncbi:MAG: biotin transporter BioY [Clostridia bacterium]|nr:biotin transporter BioY [Clostridia bacterium]
MKRKNKIIILTLTAMFTAVIAVLSQISIPMPAGVPLTLQTFAIALCGYTLGKKYAAISVVAYLFLGIIGIPVFTGFKGGPGVFASYTGGFLIGFIFMAFICGIFTGKEKRVPALILGAPALIACHLPGVIWFSHITGTSFLTAFLTVSLPFLLKDAASVCLAWAIGGSLNGLLCRKMNVSLR